MLGTLLEANPSVGRIITGRVSSGSIRTNGRVKVIDRQGDAIEPGRVLASILRSVIERALIDEALAGQILVAVAGSGEVQCRDIFGAVRMPLSWLMAQPIDPPTLVDDVSRLRQSACGKGAR